MRVVYFLKRFKNVIKTAVQALIISAAHDVARPFGRNRQRARSVAVGEEGGRVGGGWMAAHFHDPLVAYLHFAWLFVGFFVFCF